MSQEEEVEDISIEDLELSLQVYEIESEQKLKTLAQLFNEKNKLDLSKMFYEEKSSLEIKFQNIVSDLTEFLINQEIASTQKLRKTFYRILENPLMLLFKVSRFEIFNLRFNAFDIQLQPIDAISQLAQSILANIQKHQSYLQKVGSKFKGGQYLSYQQFLEDAQIKLVQDQIFILYSYLRKGVNILRKRFEDKIRVVEIYNKIEQKLLKRVLQFEDAKTLKQLSILNFQIYQLQNSYDVLCFYLKVPFKSKYQQIFKQLQSLGLKAKQTSNFDLFILIFLRYNREIIQKIENEGIDSHYSSYIENVLLGLLQIWACRLCGYQEFVDLFEKLIKIHPNKIKVIKLCVEHIPNLKKDDIVLIRTNFKHQLLQKHGQLLSLFRKKEIDEINFALNSTYHQVFYNLDFTEESKQNILDIINLLNGNSLLEQFFSVVERAFKQWNRTIDFSHSQKYIESQFKYPMLQKAKILESLKLLSNFCILSKKGFEKDYQNLIKNGGVQKAIVGFINFLLKDKKYQRQIKQNLQIQTLFLTLLSFLQHYLSKNYNQWESICLVYCQNLVLFNQNLSKQLVKILKSIIFNNYECFKIKQCVNIFTNILLFETNAEIDTSQTVKDFFTLFMSAIYQINKEVLKFRYFGEQITTKEQISEQQIQFLIKFGCLNGAFVEPKDVGCFKLTELQITTNPVQFEKILDNFYFTLDSNAKRLVQFLAQKWIQLHIEDNKLIQPYVLLLSHLVEKYPVCLPILCSTRIDIGTSKNRFAQILPTHLSTHTYFIALKIMQNKCVRYKNGRNYIKEQITPMILREAIKIVNSGTCTILHFQLLASALFHSRVEDIKLDTIQKIIDQINYQISIVQNENDAVILSQSLAITVEKFFEKKQVDMRKTGLRQLYRQLLWKDVRTKTVKNNQKSRQIAKPAQINEQIMISPYALSQDYNIDDCKIQKVPEFIKSVKLQNYFPLSVLKDKIPVFNNNNKQNFLVSLNKEQNSKQIDLSNLKYNLQYYFGEENIENACRKQGYKIINKHKKESSNQHLQNKEQNSTLVFYYLKELQCPQISDELILKFILAIFKGNHQIGLCQLFANFTNAYKIFVLLLLLIDYSNKLTVKIENPKTLAQEIINYLSSNTINSLKNILKILTSLGYTNLWGETSKIFGECSFTTQIKLKINYQQTQKEECLFSLLLRVCLQKNQLKNELNELLGRLFETRPADQNILMYNVGIDRSLMNNIMKSLEIEHLNKVSIIFHSNFNNLRLYTDQLHEGMKALNMASKNRSYNEYIQLSKDIEDEEFFLPMKLFQQNFAFFIKIEKEGYNYKHREQTKLGLERVFNLIKGETKKQDLVKKIQNVVEQFMQQIQKLQINIANRVKSFYLVTKLRDLSFQNSLTISFLHEILLEKKLSCDQILTKIKNIQIFSLLNELFNQLVLFDNSWHNKNKYKNFYLFDRASAEREVTICSTRRYSHSMSKIYEKCELQFDQIFQRCIDNLRIFLTSNQGKVWREKQVPIYPAFLVKSFIDINQSNNLINQIKNSVIPYSAEKIQFKMNESFSISHLIKSLKQVKKNSLLLKNGVIINSKGTNYSLSDYLPLLKEQLIKSQTLTRSKQKYLIFNKYKASQKTLQQIQLLGLAVGYSILHNLPMDLPLHASLLAALNFGICEIDDLLDVDFKIWEDIKNVMSCLDSKDLNLNFSYIFQSLSTLQPERVELIDKGASKKVNNLNRQEYCDLICCNILYKTVSKQLQRFLQSITYVCPKELLSCSKISAIHELFLSKSIKYAKEIQKRHMSKRALILPQSRLFHGKRIQNLKDYQNIQWFIELLMENDILREKYWKDYTNLFIMTNIGGKGIQIDANSALVVINHCQSKQTMSILLNNIK